jgi:hypothetical protein
MPTMPPIPDLPQLQDRHNDKVAFFMAAMIKAVGFVRLAETAMLTAHVNHCQITLIDNGYVDEFSPFFQVVCSIVVLYFERQGYQVVCDNTGKGSVIIYMELKP